MKNSELITKFYTSFANADAEGMVACYHNDIQFEDPAFGPLKGDDAKNMWRMLIKNSKGGSKITFSDVEANDKTGSANWVAEYNFSQTGRHVINKISATYEFKDGLIIKHTDVFDMWAWSKQALGLKGYLLGWSDFLKGKIQQQTNSLLKKFVEKQKQL
jgi:ketosteroid isomerase-like protein